MKPRPTLQTKRQPASGFRILRAVTGKSRSRKTRAHRAATTAEPEDFGEVPGVGVARALVVILLLHVAAIGGIYIHNKWTAESELAAAQAGKEADVPEGPPLIPGAQQYTVIDGDNYFKIADKMGVSVNELKRLNSNVAIVSGMTINIPARQVALPVIPAADIREEPTEPILPPIAHNEWPPVHVNQTQKISGGPTGELVVEQAAPAESYNEPVLIRSRRPAAAVQRPIIPTREVSVPAGRTHVIRKGDTIWRLSKRYGVSQQELMRLNGISDPGKIRLGATLRIPGS